MYRSDANGDSGWIHGTNMPWLQEYHVAVSQTRPNRIAIGLQDNGSNRSWTNANDAVADPVAANWASYGGGDGHYVVVDTTDDTYYYSCSQNAGCSGVHDLVSTTTTLSAATAVGATNVKLASVTGLLVGGTLTIDSTGANPETVTITTVGTAGAGGTGVSFAPALAFAHASGATVVKNGVPGTQSLGFGSRGSGLRCTTDAPLVQDPSNGATLFIGCNNLSRSTNRGASWTQIAAPDLLTGPAPPDDSTSEQPALRGPVPVGLDDRRRPSPTRTRSTWAPTTGASGRPRLGTSWQQFPNPFAPAPARWVTSVIVDPATPPTRTRRSAASARATARRTSSRGRLRARAQAQEHQRQPAERAGELPRVRPAQRHASTRPPTWVSSSRSNDNKVWTSSATTCRILPRRT